MKKVYIAGPGVFHQDAAKRFEIVRLLADRYGLEALIPFNPELSDPDAIYQNCVTLMLQADAAVVDLKPFRGTEPDSGSAFEAGFLRALHKPIVGYCVDPRLTQEKTIAHFDAVSPGWQFKDGAYFPDHMCAEEFGYTHNLMLVKSMQIVGNLVDALQLVAQMPTPQNP